MHSISLSLISLPCVFFFMVKLSLAVKFQRTVHTVPHQTFTRDFVGSVDFQLYRNGTALFKLFHVILTCWSRPILRSVLLLSFHLTF
jgi:hypothetical protein